MRPACSMVLGIASAFACQHALAEPVFQCMTAAGKTIKVTRNHAGDFVYSFGRAASPELVFEVPQHEADIYKWNGIGRYQLYSLGLRHGDTRYDVFSNWDSLTPSTPPLAGVEVRIGEKLVATIACSTKHPVVQNMYDLP